jgi:putative transposase
MQRRKYFAVNNNFAGPGVSAHLEVILPDVRLRIPTCGSKMLDRPFVVGLIDDWAPLFYSLTFSFIPYTCGLLNAVETALSNKADYCAKFGAKISNSEWPIEGLPASVAADRKITALLGVERLRGLGIRVVGNSSRKNRLKTILERTSPLLCGELIHWRTWDFEKAPPSRIVVTPDEFQRVLNECVLRYHRSVLKNFRLASEIMPAGIQPTPIELLRFANKNEPVLFKTIPLSEARVNLLPRGKAVVTACGTRFNGMTYYSSLALRERWFERARNCGNWEVPVAYDPRLVDRIFLAGQKDGFETPLELAPSHAIFSGLSWLEFWNVRKQQRDCAIMDGQDKSYALWKTVAATPNRKSKMRRK